MTLKKLLVASAAGVLVASTAFAGTHVAANTTGPQFGVTGSYDNSNSGLLTLGASQTIGLSMQTDMFEAGVAAAAGRLKVANVKTTTYQWTANAGVRQMMANNFYGALGVKGSLIAYSTKGSKNDHSIGAYVGMEYQPSSAVQLFVRVLPVNFLKDKNANVERYSFFNTGQVGFTYFFA